MPEVKDPVRNEETAPEVGGTPVSAEDGIVPAATASSGKEKPKRPPMSPKKKKKLIRWSIIGGVVLIAVIVLAKVLGGSTEPAAQVVEDTVTYNSITSTVEGSGITRAKESKTITLTTSGTAQEVFVTEGQQVTAGTPLFVVDSETARTAVEKARKDMDGYQKQLNAMNKDIAGLNLTPPFAGKLMDTVKLNVGEEIAKDTKVATLVDDRTMKLQQYYSYAYKGDIRTGQTANVSIPALMGNVTGTVSAVHMVDRISPEGSRLFEVEFSVKNPGTLTKDMVASAVLSVGGESVYPYESGKLDYNRMIDLKTTVNGTIVSTSLLDYMDVTPGQVLVKIDGEDSQNELFTLEQNLADAQKALDTAQENLDNCSAVAPIDGTVMGLALTAGEDVAANTTVISIADTSTILIDATVDERNISYVKAGMPVDLDQWGTKFTGMVESVSLNSKVTNGVAAYPMVISVDNTDGSLMSGSNVTYSLVASQNDNCLTLPIQSVKNAQFTDGSSGYVVFVKADKAPENTAELAVPVDGVPDGYYPVPVEIGISDNYNVEIKSGVEEGTTVFTTTQMQNSYGY
ncbi:HlyD family efflux transporter periplasmic adaptor subunit [Oscillibacter sp.]|uniref:HlyD family efflux transporter periplasmic adaptor subunit n=1 Tax=Oscillibacter sp. TaxID=1945593 RepID=UPI003393E918